MLRKQLQNLSFTYKISKSHLSFQIMQYGEATDIWFHYNPTKNCFSSSPSGMTYGHFVTHNKNRTLGTKHNNSAIVPAPQSTAGLEQSKQSNQAAASQVAASDPSQTLSHQSSVAQAANTSSNAFDSFVDTPRRRFQLPPRPLRRDLLSEIEDPDSVSVSRPPFTGASARLESLRNRQASDNRRIIKAIVQATKVICDSDMIEELFTTKTGWNITKYGLLSLALHGVIPVVDRRLVLSEKSEDEDEDKTHNIVESDVSKENDTAKDK
jgi:hypothetical protein